jgi:hypothetical protein
LPVEARRLEDEAIEAGEESPKGRELRAKAAALRVQALGERVYPVLVCGNCFAVTGWTDENGVCDKCVRASKLASDFSDAHSGWVDLGAPRVLGSQPRRRRFRLRRQREVDTWLSRVDPGETGPIAPEERYALEVARRDELEAADGSGLIVRFRTATCRFADGAWVDEASSDIAARDLLVPTEFGASLPAEQLAEAWGDFRAAVHESNRRAWSLESARRDRQRQADATRADAMREQRDAADLLDES